MIGFDFLFQTFFKFTGTFSHVILKMDAVFNLQKMFINIKSSFHINTCEVMFGYNRV